MKKVKNHLNGDETRAGTFRYARDDVEIISWMHEVEDCN
jgi:hypothetical protein